MTENRERDASGSEMLRRMTDAVWTLVDCLEATAPSRPDLVQFHELLSLWRALPTREDREHALALLRTLNAHRRH